jgi:xylono-1,5-lactonase
MTDMKLIVKGEHKLGESMLWHEAHKCLYWVDLYEPMLCRFDLMTKELVQRPLALPAPIGSIVATSDPQHLLIAHGKGLSLLNLVDLSLTAFADPEQGRCDVIANDMKVDRWGRLWFGTSHVRETLPRGALWCVESNKAVHLADVGFAISNGPAFSLGGYLMYFSDSFNRQILCYDLSKQDCRLRNRRVLATFTEDEGLPDGLTVDAEGCVWVALWSGAAIMRLSAKGEKLGRFDVPAGHVTSLAFCGETIFITTARDGLSDESLEKYPLSGSVFAVDVGVAGVSERVFEV